MTTTNRWTGPYWARLNAALKPNAPERQRPIEVDKRKRRVDSGP